MAAGPTQATAPASLSRTGTIRRERLIDALDSARPAIRTLVAPAGYGKTVLATEWSAEGGRTSVWCPIRPQHVDVAALAVEVARRAHTVAPECGRRLRERLATAQEPAVDARLTAEMLAEDLLDWPPDAWLVLDDYHHLVGAEDAEVFVQELLRGAPVKALITTRERPSWVTTRHLIYGEVFELGQAELAMTREEAGVLLADRPPDERAGLIALADGWPAVIGLARRLPRPVDFSAGFPDEIYDYFAEEVYQSLAPELRRALCLFALAPSLDRELAAELAGPDEIDTVIREAESIGLMAVRQGQPTLHPLAATFLLQRGADQGRDRSLGVTRCLEHYLARREWDPLFDLILRERLLPHLYDVLTLALAELLNSGRLATIRSVIEASGREKSSHPIVDLARAEVALREGNTFAASAHALGAIDRMDDTDPLSFRALVIAARAAHIGNREDEAIQLYTRAEGVASSDGERREAWWGLLSSLSQVESDDAWDVLERLRSDGTWHGAEDIVRDATRCLLLELRSGALRSLSWGRRASEVVSEVRDPIARCSFRNVYASALSVYGDYALAADVADELRRDAEQHRLTFVLPVAACTLAQALCGLRRYREAEELITNALVTAVRTHDTLLEPLAASLLVRLRCQDGRVPSALSVTCDLADAVVSVRGEYLASRALALACTSRFDEALSAVTEATTVTRAIEPRVLAMAVHAIVSLRSKARETPDSCQAFLDLVEESNGYDLLVASYRASPELAAYFLANAHLRSRVSDVMRRVGDTAILEASGASVSDDGSPAELLSKREFEVYELLCAGLSNRQIAQCLFISEETVKAHAHHIFDKLGMRSRHALAIDALRRRASQATDAT
jgi:LuxR family maltose regulon positive regulatory protein